MSAENTWLAFDDEMRKLGVLRAIARGAGTVGRGAVEATKEVGEKLQLLAGSPAGQDLTEALSDILVTGPAGTVTELAARTAVPVSRRLRGLPNVEDVARRQAEVGQTGFAPGELEQMTGRTAKVVTAAAFDDEMRKLGGVMSVLTHPATLGAGLGAGGVSLANEIHSVVDPAEQQKPRGERLKELGLGAGIGAVTHPLLMQLVKRRGR